LLIAIPLDVQLAQRRMMQAEAELWAYVDRVSSDPGAHDSLLHRRLADMLSETVKEYQEAICNMVMPS